MANVALHSDSAASAFLAAQENKSVRSLLLGIESEAFVVRGTQTASSDVQADFDSIVASLGLSDSVASFVLFCLDAEPIAEGARSWVFISWVPDRCKPKDKMLYSSSR